MTLWSPAAMIQRLEYGAYPPDNVCGHSSATSAKSMQLLLMEIGLQRGAWIQVSGYGMLIKGNNLNSVCLGDELLTRRGIVLTLPSSRDTPHWLASCKCETIPS